MKQITDEQIKEAATLHVKPFKHQLHLGEKDSVKDTFMAGAQWLRSQMEEQWIPVEPRTKELTDRMNGCDSRLVQCLFDTGEILAFNDDHPFAIMTHICFLPALPSATKEGGKPCL